MFLRLLADPTVSDALCVFVAALGLITLATGASTHSYDASTSITLVVLSVGAVAAMGIAAIMVVTASLDHLYLLASAQTP